jgi:hypothetical protein
MRGTVWRGVGRGSDSMRGTAWRGCRAREGLRDKGIVTAVGLLFCKGSPRFKHIIWF